jgi:hypothetical protein
MNSIGNYANQASMAGVGSGSYLQTATEPVEPDGAPGSLLGEIQALEKAALSVEKAFDIHGNILRDVLLPEMNSNEKNLPSAPEPMRSQYANRVNSVMRTLRVIESRIHILTERAKLT